jgi:DNA polymerase III epsilon subunit-like protein
MRWSDTPIHFIDFEGNLTSGILEYGVVTLFGGRVAQAQTRLCGPIGCIRPADTAIHRLDARAVAAESPFVGDFEIFGQLRETGPLAAHYAHAENTLIKSAWPYPRTSPDFARPGESVTTWGPWIDTGRLYTQLFPGLPSGKLEELVSAFQIGPLLERLSVQYCPAGRRHFHAALYDALAGALLLLSLGDRPEFQGVTLGWLLQMSTLNPGHRAALQQRELF